MSVHELFFGSRETAVGTSVSRVVQDELIPDPYREALVATVVNDDDVTRAIKNAALNHPVHRFEQAHRFGSNPAKYESNRHFYRNLLTKEVVEAETGRSIEFQYVEFAPLNSIHFGWEWLYSQNYDPVNNEIKDLSASVGFTCYLDAIIKLYCASIVTGKPLPAKMDTI